MMKPQTYLYNNKNNMDRMFLKREGYTETKENPKVKSEKEKAISFLVALGFALLTIFSFVFIVTFAIDLGLNIV